MKAVVALRVSLRGQSHLGKQEPQGDPEGTPG